MGNFNSSIQRIFSGLGGLLLNPITLAIIGVIALIVLLYTYWDSFSAWFQGLQQSFAEIISGVWNFILGIFQFVMKIIDDIGSAIMWVLQRLGLIESKKIEVAPVEAVSSGLSESNNKAQEFAAAFSGQALSGAINENSFKIKNDTKVDVKIQPSNTIVNIDGDRVGEAVSQYIVRQNVRHGAGEIE